MSSSSPAPTVEELRRVYSTVSGYAVQFMLDRLMRSGDKKEKEGREEIYDQWLSEGEQRVDQPVVSTTRLLEIVHGSVIGFS